MVLPIIKINKQTNTMSCLSLSDGELKIGYTRYLLIKEICPTEIALFIHSLEIQHRRKAAYACFF